MPERGQPVLDAFCDAATYRPTGAPLLASAEAIRKANAEERAAVLAAAVRSQAEAQRRFRKASARPLAVRDLSAFAQLEREPAELAPRAYGAQGLIAMLVKFRDDEWSDEDLLSQVDALTSFGWRSGSLIDDEAIARAMTSTTDRALRSRSRSRSARAVASCCRTSSPVTKSESRECQQALPAR